MNEFATITIHDRLLTAYCRHVGRMMTSLRSNYQAYNLTLNETDEEDRARRVHLRWVGKIRTRGIEVLNELVS